MPVRFTTDGQLCERPAKGLRGPSLPNILRSSKESLARKDLVSAHLTTSSARCALLCILAILPNAGRSNS